MRIVVNVDKMRAELRPVECFKRGEDNTLSAAELEAFMARLQGAGSLKEIAARCDRKPHNYTLLMSRVRDMLDVRDDLELAMLAYERGYVMIEEEGR